MILKAKPRGDGRQLGRYLLTMGENEHIEVHEVRGFVSDDVAGALSEVDAIAKGTKCRQSLFSVSLNPPPNENVRIQTFEKAIEAIEEKNGLSGQPRVVVFHEKEGRRHCHAVWSRIDAETMTAKPLPFFKNKLQEVSKQLYLENGWQMPRGLIDKQNRDPRNFTLAEWQQAKRSGRHAGEIKGLIQEAWAISDTRQSFSHALEERGFYLARGDRRAYAAVTFEGEVIAIPRAIGKKTKDVRERLGKAEELRSIEETRQRIAEGILPRMKSHLDEARGKARLETGALNSRRSVMTETHAEERAKLDAGQKQRFEDESRNRADRLRKGVLGLWDKLTGKRAKLEKQNEMEALWALQRDREQRHAVIASQMQERQNLQAEITATRSRHAQALLDLHSDTANYRLMQRGEAPKPRAKTSFERLEALREKSRQPESQRQSKPATQIKPKPKRQPLSPDERLKRLRERREQQRDRGPELEP
ncbi:relaxase/mobilization nuclease domain-containing protein [uncultured Roseibium sp.]|uniref:relaxase/mobilization nuclease domain-containing protein n=1 Tax=uncultured Roseibium sp. TaxID=1936171 RepID=UPI00262FA0D2|nr:relaxase/mobilization nuclease domain-containing protein [uncultured Roseibium sp.]